jgi:hypothetical protein
MFFTFDDIYNKGKNIMVIYMTTNLINGKRYIGKDKHNNPDYLGSGTRLKLAIQKYGKSNFKKEILEECSSWEDMGKKEVEWIKKYNATTDTNFYNISDGNEFTGKGNSTAGWTDEDMEAFKVKMRRVWEELDSPEFRTSLSNAQKEKYAMDSEYRQRRKDGTKRWWDNASEEWKTERNNKIKEWWKHNKRETNSGGRPPKTEITEQMKTDIISDWESGFRKKEIMEKYQVSKWQLKKILK